MKNLDLSKLKESFTPSTEGIEEVEVNKKSEIAIPVDLNRETKLVADKAVTAHDPTGAIFKSNQEVNKKLELGESSRRVTGHHLDQNKEVNGKLETHKRILAILRTSGMDSQQADKAFEQIKRVLG